VAQGLILSSNLSIAKKKKKKNWPGYPGDRDQEDQDFKASRGKKVGKNLVSVISGTGEAWEGR
jgi:hypothetical protein